MITPKPLELSATPIEEAIFPDGLRGMILFNT